MIQYKSIVSPSPRPASRDWTKVEKLTVPDQSLSLQDILERFTRKEALPIGKEVSYNDEVEIDSPFAVDLEKLAKADIIDKNEAVAQWKEVSQTYEREQKAREAQQKKAAEKAAKEAEESRIQKEVEARVAKQSSKESAV